MSLQPRYLPQFPYLNRSKDLLGILNVLEEEEISLAEKLTKIISHLFQRYPELNGFLKLLFENIVKNNERIKESFIQQDMNHPGQVALYHVGKILANCFNNRVLYNGFANIWAKDCEMALKKLNLRKNRELVLIGKEFGIDSVPLTPRERKQLAEEQNSYLMMDFKVKYINYIMHIQAIKDSHYKLTNRIVSDGYVYLIKGDLVHLIREALRSTIIQQQMEIPLDIIEALKMIPDFQDVYNYIEQLLEENKQKYSGSNMFEGQEVSSELFPPCVNLILEKANQGVNLNHYERLAIAFFFLNTNHSVEETIDVFRTSPDFDENICRYQVEHASGKDTGKPYTMFGCDKMKSYGLCHADHPQLGDKICTEGVYRKGATEPQPIKNPLNFVFWKRVELERQKNKRTWTE